jgi:hypothetical protein
MDLVCVFSKSVVKSVRSKRHFRPPPCDGVRYKVCAECNSHLPIYSCKYRAYGCCRDGGSSTISYEHNWELAILPSTLEMMRYQVLRHNNLFERDQSTRTAGSHQGHTHCSTPSLWKTTLAECFPILTSTGRSSLVANFLLACSASIRVPPVNARPAT